MYDLLIIGGSAASSAAAVYAARRKLNFLMVAQEFGGEVATAGEVWNYPGIVETTGMELAEMFKAHVKANGVEPELGVRIESITKTDAGHFEVKGKKVSDDVTYEAKTVIVATGVHPRHLDVPGEDDLSGRGVTYCTTCDGPLFKDKKVVTIGGGNSGMESALMLAEIASEVTLVNINDKFKGEEVLVEKVTNDDRINVIYNAQTTRIEGDPVVERVVYTDKESGEEKTIDAQGVFIHIGLIPNSSIVPDDVKKNTFGEIEVDMRAETSVPGLYAAGDVTNIPFKQITIATGQGATAALSAVEYLNKLDAK